MEGRFTRAAGSTRTVTPLPESRGREQALEVREERGLPGLRAGQPEHWLSPVRAPSTPTFINPYLCLDGGERLSPSAERR